MPRFYRNGQTLLRIFLLLVLGMGLLGWWWGSRAWDPALVTQPMTEIAQGVDWMELTASVLEDLIEIVQGASGR